MPRAKIAVLRAMAAVFVPFRSSAPSPLVKRRVVTATPRAFVEKAVNSGQTVPALSETANADFTDMLARSSRGLANVVTG